MFCADRSTVFTADGYVLTILKFCFRFADSTYVLHIYNVRSMRPYKKHVIESGSQILKPAIERIGFFLRMECDTAQM